ncbi:MAG: RluA family pseudouridine synthase [Saprospiraceae bacterium]
MKKKKQQFNVDMPTIFEDEYLLIVNKPGGIATNGNRNKTVEQLVRPQRFKKMPKDKLPKPVAAHRIDVPTKGLVILAKSKRALAGMGKLFQNRQVSKTYFAIVHGKLQGTGRIDQPIDGKKSITDYEVEKTVQSRAFGHLTLVKLFPQTGRTHQLRIHLQQKGHLIIGDKMYAGAQRTILGKGLFLCAAALEFTHPITNKLVNVHIELPSRFQRLLEREESRF